MNKSTESVQLRQLTSNVVDLRIRLKQTEDKLKETESKKKVYQEVTDKEMKMKELENERLTELVNQMKMELKGHARGTSLFLHNRLPAKTPSRVFALR